MGKDVFTITVDLTNRGDVPDFNNVRKLPQKQNMKYNPALQNKTVSESALARWDLAHLGDYCQFSDHGLL